MCLQDQAIRRFTTAVTFFSTITMLLAGCKPHKKASVTIHQQYCILSIDGKDDSMSAVEVIASLKEKKPDDTLYIYLRTGSAGSMDTILSGINKLQIKNQIVVTEDFFKLPK